MRKIVLDAPTSGFNRTRIDSNFMKIEQEFQDKVLYQVNPFSESNQIKVDLVMNRKSLLDILSNP